MGGLVVQRLPPFLPLQPKRCLPKCAGGHLSSRPLWLTLAMFDLATKRRLERFWGVSEEYPYSRSLSSAPGDHGNPTATRFGRFAGNIARP